MKLFDAHAHYYDEKFDTLPGGADALLAKLFAGDLAYVLNCATTTGDSERVLTFADRYPGCFAAVGVHPEDCGGEEGPEEAVKRLEELLKHPKAVAVGEIGLDYYWPENPPKEVQKAYFEAQLELARRAGYPVIVHDRDAHGDVFEILSRYPDVVAVLHSYSGSPEMARQYLKNPNRYISFSGVLTYKNAEKAVETAKLAPLDRILSETDCPYLAPVPYRGKVNHSGYMIRTVERLAEIKGLTVEETAGILFENAKRLFIRSSSAISGCSLER